jgi:lysophospholipase L1-like esterase
VAPPRAPLRYLALGDSYTIGEGVTERGRWPLQLAAALRAGGRELAPPRIIARTGWTTDELDAAIDAESPAPGWDLVSLLIGVNNQYRGRGLDEYRQQFDALLRRAMALADGVGRRVLVLSIPDWGQTPFARAQGCDAQRIAAEIDAFNQAARETCGRHGVAFVDVTAAGRTQAHDAAMLTEDGLHPSAHMYAQWAALALPAARDALACAPAASARE